MSTVGHDQEGDYFEVVSEDAPASLEKTGDGLFERCTLDGRVVGFAVFNVSKHDRDQLTLPFSTTAI